MNFLCGFNWNKQSDEQSVNQSDEQSVKQSDEQSVKQLDKQSVKQLDKQLDKQSIEQSVKNISDKSFYQPYKEQTLDELTKISDKFKIINPKDIPYFSFKEKIFIAMHCNIYDGDTFSVIFDYKGDLIKYKCRCMGYDTAEMKPLLSKPNRIHEKELAHKAKDRLEELLNKHPSKLIKIECFEFDKYGRLLINVWNMVDTDSINDIMVKEGHGKVYDGGTKVLF